MSPLAKIGCAVLGTALLAGVLLSSEGFVHVRVDEKTKNGTHISVIAPAVLAPLAIQFVPQKKLRRAVGEKAWLPIAEAAASGLAGCPDGVLVEVTDPQEHVVVAKSGGAIAVDVRDSRETVEVSVPLRALDRTLHQIAQSAGPP